MLKEPYCTTIEADTIILTDAWLELPEEEKYLALQWGRVYLDSKYRCRNLYLTEIEDALNAKKVANALLGEQYSLGTLFTVSATNSAQLVEKTVKAGSVSIGKKYDSGTGASTDPCPQATDVLAPYCSFISSNSLKQTPVIRA